jgi:hypothetical protein
MVITPAIYLGGTGLKYQLGDWLSWLKSFCFPEFLQASARIDLNQAMTVSFYILSSALFIDLFVCFLTSSRGQPTGGGPPAWGLGGGLTTHHRKTPNLL